MWFNGDMDNDLAKKQKEKNDFQLREGWFAIRGTKVKMPYRPEMTPAECRLVFSLEKIFRSELILADAFFPKKQAVSVSVRERGDGLVTGRSGLLQIDALAIDERGIFVFESKDYVGWIYGNAKYPQWTQVSAYGRNKHKFYNPVRQNLAHAEAVRAVFGGLIPVHTVIVFGREAVLKKIEELPEDCYVCGQAGLRNMLDKISKKGRGLSEIEQRQAYETLFLSLVKPERNVRDEHVEEIMGMGG